ncbi:CLUMA_CG009645, isoform B [Clunio marinus]|uniref:CLUMA_CG009645, isoform B n=1 Tax=Clunio marinus TaxID=568069 RepID=A0A1J1ICQ2_9DIPT|nr:CLUMA_CG009645, isoform B [Clunio marinus]
MKLEIEELKKMINDGLNQITTDDDCKTDGDLNKENKEIRNKNIRKEKLSKHILELELDLKKKENEKVKVRADNSDGYNKIKALEEKYPWIEEDKGHFGVKNTRYDFTKEDPNVAFKKLNSLIRWYAFV